MASTITITCPECDKQLRAPSNVLGKKIRCKGCGATFSARAAAGKSASAKTSAKSGDKAKTNAAADEEDANPYGVTEEYMGRRCPDCTEALDDDQIVCLNCGYNTMSRVRARTRKVRDITPLDIFIWLLPGILCALLVLTLLGLDIYYIFQINRETFGDAWYDFLGASGTKIWASIFILFICFGAGTFAVKRLIFNYMPPEVEEKMQVNPK